MDDFTLDELAALRDAAIDGSVADALWAWTPERRVVLTDAVRKLRCAIREKGAHQCIDVPIVLIEEDGDEAIGPFPEDREVMAEWYRGLILENLYDEMPSDERRMTNMYAHSITAENVFEMMTEDGWTVLRVFTPGGLPDSFKGWNPYSGNHE